MLLKGCSGRWLIKAEIEGKVVRTPECLALIWGPAVGLDCGYLLVAVEVGGGDRFVHCPRSFLLSLWVVGTLSPSFSVEMFASCLRT